MAWIRSESSLPRHPKTLHLIALSGQPLDVVLGRLHLLWYWCLDFAIDGDLSKKEPKMIQESCQLPLKVLIKAGFIDSRPYRRIHDWWEIQGTYLRTRFQHQPEKWQRIKQLYDLDSASSVPTSKLVYNLSDGRTDVRTDVTDVRTYKEKESASRGSPGGSPAPLKSFEEATDDEPCLPPKGMWDKVKKGMK